MLFTRRHADVFAIERRYTMPMPPQFAAEEMPTKSQMAIPNGHRDGVSTQATRCRDNNKHHVRRHNRRYVVYAVAEAYDAYSHADSSLLLLLCAATILLWLRRH